MIPLWTEKSSLKYLFNNIKEDCYFCKKPTDTWHENTKSFSW